MTALSDEERNAVPTEDAPMISYVVARLERAVRHSITGRVKPHGLTTLQYTTLSVLGAKEHLSNAQLARRAYMTPQAMIEVTEALESKGLIKRKQHPDHGRILTAALTARGRKVLDRCNASVAEMETEMLSGLSASQRACLRTGLLTAVRSMNAGFPST